MIHFVIVLWNRLLLLTPSQNSDLLSVWYVEYSSSNVLWTSLQTIVQGFCKLDNIKILPASRILDSANVSDVTSISFYIYQLLCHYSDHNILLTCMYVLCLSLVDVHTHSSTCNLSLHKEKFEPASMEHNYF